MQYCERLSKSKRWAGKTRDGKQRNARCKSDTSQLANRKTIIEFSVIYRAHVIPLVEQSARYRISVDVSVRVCEWVCTHSISGHVICQFTNLPIHSSNFDHQLWHGHFQPFVFRVTRTHPLYHSISVPSAALRCSAPFQSQKYINSCANLNSPLAILLIIIIFVIITFLALYKSTQKQSTHTHSHARTHIHAI